MLSFLVVVAAGAGAVLRYLVDQVVQHRLGAELPWGTAVVNVTGALFLGVITGLALHHGLPATPTLVLGTGFAGGYSTLSTWAWETLALAEAGDLLEASLNVLGSFALGLAAAALGLGLTLI